METRPEQPEAPPLLVLDPVIVADRVERRRTPSGCHHSSAIRSGPSARVTRCRRRRQVKRNGGSSGNSQNASTGSGGSNSRIGRGGFGIPARPPACAATLPRLRGEGEAGGSADRHPNRGALRDVAFARFDAATAQRAPAGCRAGRGAARCRSPRWWGRSRRGRSAREARARPQRAARITSSTPRPGSTVSSRSLKSAARWRGSRLGRAVPRRIRSTRPSTR